MKYIALVFYYGLFRYFPRSSFPLVGKLCKKLRYICCKAIFKSCGKNVNIERMAFFGSGFNIEIGDNSGLGRSCFVQSSIKIGKNVLIGPNLYVHPRNHGFKVKDTPIIQQDYTGVLQTIIEDDVWIGRDVMLTPGRHIRKGIVIGTRALVTKDFEEFSVVGGNPAKKIGERE